MKALLPLLFTIVVSPIEAGDSETVRDAIAAGAIAHCKICPPKEAFTIILSPTYQFELGREVPAKIVEAILKALPEDQRRKYIPFGDFPPKQKFPSLARAPEKKIDYYFLGTFEYLDDDHIEVTIGYSWERLKMDKRSYSVTRKNGEWIAIQTGYFF